eukprot:904453-Amphidinium_carterae.2
MSASVPRRPAQAVRLRRPPIELMEPCGNLLVFRKELPPFAQNLEAFCYRQELFPTDTEVVTPFLFKMCVGVKKPPTFS